MPYNTGKPSTAKLAQLREAVDKASEEKPVDISYVITNADATRYNNFHAKQPVGWTLSRDDAFECEYANYLPAKVGSSYFNKWQSSGNLTDRSIKQQLSGLPDGKYRLSVLTGADQIHAGAWLVANSDKTEMTQLTDSKVSVETEIADGSLTFGVELKNYTSNDCKFDHFTLEYLGGSSVTGIESVQNEEGRTVTDHSVYDITGRRIERPSKGLYIVNGQKTIVR